MKINFTPAKSALISTSLCLILTLSGCATNQYMQPQALAPQESAKIYITRPSAFFGSALTAPIYINNNLIGRISNGGQLTWITPPGPITISTSTATAGITVDKAGSHSISFHAQKAKTYYVKVSAPYQVQLTAPFFGEAEFELQLTNKS